MAISSTLNTFRMAEKLSIPQLVQALQNHTIDASVGQLVLNNKLQEKKRMEAAQGGGAPQSTVADDNINEAGRMAGVAAAPMDPNAFRQQGFSGGGIVGYAEGGSVIDRLAEKYGYDPKVLKDALSGAVSSGAKRINNFFSIPTDTAVTSAISTIPALGMANVFDRSTLRTADQMFNPRYRDAAAPAEQAPTMPPEQRMPPPQPPQGPQGGAAGIASSLPGGVSFRAPQLQGYDEILKGNDPVARMRALSALRQGELEKGDTEAFSELRGDMDKQKGELAKDKEQNKWLSLMKAGFSMAGGDSQYALQNIGKGAEEGVNAFVQRDIINREMQNRLAMRDQAVKLEQIAMRKGNMAQADQYGAQAAQADQQAKQLSMQAVDAQNRNQMGIAGLNLEAQKVNQAAATQRAMLQMSKDRYSAMEKAAEARMMQARQKAVTDFMSSPMYSQLDAYLRNEYGKNWRFADDARSKEAQFIFGRKLQEHMQTTMPTIIEGMEGGGGGYPGVRDAYDLLNAE